MTTTCINCGNVYDAEVADAGCPVCHVDAGERVDPADLPDSGGCEVYIL
jgi:predicted  nucleic acid-binding Zn-ribbon protein